MKTSTQTITLTLTPQQAAVLLIVSGSTRSGVSNATRDLYCAYAILRDSLGVKPSNLVDVTKGVLAISNLSPEVDEIVKAIVQASRHADPFAGKNLPKGILFFEYPEHGSGKLVKRWLKVEKVEPTLISGYEIDEKGAMTWNYKSFDQRKMENRQVSE